MPYLQCSKSLMVGTERAVTTTWTDEELDAGPATRVPTRIYRPGGSDRAAPLVLHLHGGAFINGSLDTGHEISKLLASSGAVVVAADYPRAPEFRFPHALEVTFALLTRLHRNRGRWAGRKSAIFVAGEEAGGNLAAGLALMARDRHMPPLAGQILISPMLDPRLATCSMREADAGPVGCKWADGWHQYLGTAEKAGHPYASPLGSSRLAGLCPALIVTAKDDLLRDEGLSYGEQLRHAGVHVEAHVLPSPTGWPSELSGTAPLQSSWGSALHDRFTDFLLANSSIGSHMRKQPSDQRSSKKHTEPART